MEEFHSEEDEPWYDHHDLEQGKRWQPRNKAFPVPITSLCWKKKFILLLNGTSFSKRTMLTTLLTMWLCLPCIRTRDELRFSPNSSLAKLMLLIYSNELQIGSLPPLCLQELRGGIDLACNSLE